MVSQQETRRSWNGRPQLSQPFCAQSNYAGQQQPQQQAQQGQPGGQPAFPDQAHRAQLSADHLQSRLQPQAGHAEHPPAGAAGMPSLPGSLGQVHSMPGLSQQGGIKQDSPQMAASQHIGSPGPVKAESTQGGAPQAGQSGQANGHMPVPASLNSPLVGQGPQPTMSNGKPVMLRGARDWPAAHSPAMPNVRPTCC